MKRAATILLAVGAVFSLTGCGDGSDEPEKPYVSDFEKCIAAGGDWVDGAWGDACYLNGAPDEH